ncbi:hypothetical protein NOS3756_38990 [Nostoc sp. NIES-3756]|jgi:uncharacterized protein YcnI|uniref:hypothetical protein n=1 Tax=Nostoc sp. NIES-3756 TaxID=1751286 RepID=UPI000721D071|nr:hypothetical protein [Nostoc sp. NIES-3756]BAT54924.1 hypothetical protein NOS3756_38990 [Nostoc sp. NIES-3756]
MKPIKQVSSTYNFPKGLVLTLALASLLSSGVGLVNDSAAVAAPTVKSVELSQRLQSRLPGYVARAVINDASRRSGVRNVRVTQATSRTFGNPCEFNFGEVCTREYRPIEGWEVVVRVRNQSWTYHVNQSGTQIVLDPKNNVGAESQLPRAIANNILSDVTRRFRVPRRELQIIKANRRTFGNPCEFNFGEICTREYRPIEGWEVVVQGRNQSWTYHVNQSGTQIVLDPKNNVGAESQLPRAIANNILNDAARRSRLSTRDVEITKVTPRTFSNPCRFNFGEICTEEYRPIQGWEVVVRVRNQFWTYHVNQSNSQFVLDPNV